MIFTIWNLKMRRKYIWNLLKNMWKVWRTTIIKEHIMLKSYSHRLSNEKSSLLDHNIPWFNIFKKPDKQSKSGNLDSLITESISSQNRRFNSILLMIIRKSPLNFSLRHLHQHPRNLTKEWKVNFANSMEKTAISTVWLKMNIFVRLVKKSIIASRKKLQPISKSRT